MEKKVRSKWNYVAQGPDEICLVKGEVLTCAPADSSPWWFGFRSTGQKGLFPKAFCESVEDDSIQAGLPSLYTLLETSPPRPESGQPSAARIQAATKLWSSRKENQPAFKRTASSPQNKIAPLSSSSWAVANLPKKEEGEGEGKENGREGEGKEGKEGKGEGKEGKEREREERGEREEKQDGGELGGVVEEGEKEKEKEKEREEGESERNKENIEEEGEKEVKEKEVKEKEVKEKEAKEVKEKGGGGGGGGGKEKIVVKGGGEKKSKRMHIVNELLATEDSYVRGLTLLQSSFVDPLTLNGLINNESGASCMKLFGSLQSISSFHQGFLKDLRSRCSRNDENIKVGDLLCQMLPFFKLYVEYVNFYAQSLEEIRMITKNKKQNQIFSKLKAGTNGEYEGMHGFSSLLVAPIQRIPRYEMLLRDLHQNTAPGHVDYESLTLAAEGTRSISNYINEQKRKIEIDLRMGKINSGLRGQQKDLMMRDSVYVGSSEPNQFKGKAKPHSWKPKSFKTPVWCFLCNKVCVENGKFKGFQCKNCPITAHKECMKNVPSSCGLATGNESLLKHDRVLIEEVPGVIYCQVISGEIKSKQRTERVKNCTLFIFNDSFVCLEAVGDDEFELLCMIKLYSRSSRRFAFLSNTRDKSIAVTPARESQVHHRFLFDTEERKTKVEAVMTDVIVQYRKMHEEQEVRRVNRVAQRKLK